MLRELRRGKPKKQWHIVGYAGTTIIYEVDLPHVAYSESRMHELLRALACKSLTCPEIVEAHAKTKGRDFGTLLEVRRDASVERLILSCSENPHFIATLPIV
jgi:hypothetical protein